jgi:hypothetical protein
MGHVSRHGGVDMTFWRRGNGVPLTRMFRYSFSPRMRTRGDMPSFAIAFALTGARKLVRGFREQLNEVEHYRVAA